MASGLASGLDDAGDVKWRVFAARHDFNDREDGTPPSTEIERNFPNGKTATKISRLANDFPTGNMSYPGIAIKPAARPLRTAEMVGKSS
jgi:hypothetical protein